MTTSIENEVETQILNAITSAGVTGVGFYNRERNAPKTLPYVYADVDIKSEKLRQFTGIFECSAVVRYSARADTSTNQNFDNKFQQILQAFYTEPSIADQMTSASTSVIFYIARVKEVNPIVVSQTRVWSRDISLELEVTSKET